MANLDAFYRNNYQEISRKHQVKKPKGATEAPPALLSMVEEAEFQVIGLLFLKREGSKCDASLQQALENLKHAYSAINTPHENTLEAAKAFLIDAEKVVNRMPHGNGFIKDYDVCSQGIEEFRTYLLKECAPIKPSELEPLNESIKQIVLSHALRENGHKCELQINQAQDNFIKRLKRLAPEQMAAEGKAEDVAGRMMEKLSVFIRFNMLSAEAVNGGKNRFN